MAEKLGSRRSPMTNKSPLLATAQPVIQGHEEIIRIRPYRPSDSEQVRELFKMYGPQSITQATYRAQWKGPTACVSYCSLSLGIFLATLPTTGSPRMRYSGIALCIFGCALFVALRYMFSYVISDAIQQALNGDLKDVGKSFGMKPVVNNHGKKTGGYVPSGASGFWVAEAYEKGSEIDESKTKIIGSIGIDANRDAGSAELRRMIVSADYRRHGIAVSLIKTGLHHVQTHGVTSVVLSTTMFQPGAIALYEKFGWVLQRKEGIRLLLDRLWVFHYSLELATVKT